MIQGMSSRQLSIGTAATGFQLHKDTHVTIRIPERVQLYAVADNPGAVVSILQVGGI